MAQGETSEMINDVMFCTPFILMRRDEVPQYLLGAQYIVGPRKTTYFKRIRRNATSPSSRHRPNTCMQPPSTSGAV
jgi:hypothetical protein